ncbi:glycosyltransferase family 4 protein [Negadavirga shengliensis]|uniref:Glycosyltransferase family 4 protein n=1 Tax=Negadavirga shengliensis TaxID=1389218 RepID=A0ABV9SYW6_9BACT
MDKIKDRKIVVINQATNYLTIGFCNSFYERFGSVSLITGSIHVQGEQLNPAITVTKINKWVERPSWKKMFSFLRAMLSMWVLLLTRYRKHEVFFVSLPPMAYLLNLVLPNRFSMVIWDVYPDVFKITGMRENHAVYKLWSRLNRRSFRKAYRVFTISDRMADLLQQYVDRAKIIVQPIWSIFQENEKVIKEENPFVQIHSLDTYFVVQYSGNIGLTHKVEVLVDLAEKMREYDHILFQIIGRGPRKPVLEKLVSEKSLPNCQFLPFQTDEMFPFSLSAADLGVVILDEKTSRGSVPSKSYNLMSYGIPSLYIASEDSQLKVYADKYNHARCYSEQQLDEAAEFILNLSESKALQKEMALAAERASLDFRRNNAHKFVEKYLNEHPIIHTEESVEYQAKNF